MNLPLHILEQELKKRYYRLKYNKYTDTSRNTVKREVREIENAVNTLLQNNVTEKRCEFCKYNHNGFCESRKSKYLLIENHFICKYFKDIM